jgi:hypothetical protein
MACRATLCLVALFIVPSRVQGQAEPTPTPAAGRVPTTEGSVVVDVFSDATCGTFAYTLTAWEGRCTVYGSAPGVAPEAARFYSVAVAQCFPDPARSDTAKLRIFKTTQTSTAQCSGEAIELGVELPTGGTGACTPMPTPLVGWYRPRAHSGSTALCRATPVVDSTLFTLRTFPTADCSGAPATADPVHLGNCTTRGYRGIFNATLDRSVTSAQNYTMVAWAGEAARPANCGGNANAATGDAVNLILALPSFNEPAVPASQGCVQVALPAAPATYATLRQAAIYIPPGAGQLPDVPLSNLEIGFIIAGSLIVVLLVFYVLLKNNLLCRAAPVQRQGARQRADVTAARVPSNVKNPVEQRGGAAAAGVVVVPNVLNAGGAGIQEYK